MIVNYFSKKLSVAHSLIHCKKGVSDHIRSRLLFSLYYCLYFLSTAPASSGWLPLFFTGPSACAAVIVHLPSKLASSSITRDLAEILPTSLPVERSSSFPCAAISPSTLPEMITCCAEILPFT